VAESEGLGAISEDVERAAEALYRHKLGLPNAWRESWNDVSPGTQEGYREQARVALAARSPDREQVSGEAEVEAAFWLREALAIWETDDANAHHRVERAYDILRASRQERPSKDVRRVFAERSDQLLNHATVPLPADRERPEGLRAWLDEQIAAERDYDNPVSSPARIEAYRAVLDRLAAYPGVVSREQPEDMGKRSPSSHPSWIRPWPDSTSREQPEGNPTHADEREAASQRIPPPPPEFLRSREQPAGLREALTELIAERGNMKEKHLVDAIMELLA
jgi:hypothetical protein